MMKTLFSVLIPLIAGITVGVVATKQEFAGVQEQFDWQRSSDVAVDPIESAPLDAPKAEIVDGNEFDFGTMSRNESRHRSFYIKNAGQVPLDVNYHTVSCGRCMQTEFERAFVPPGETVEIKVRYATLKDVPRFNEWLEVGTSDSNQRVIRFAITGNVSESIRFSDDTLIVDNLTSNQTYTGKFEIYGFLSDQLEIVDYQWSNSSTAELFSVEFQPIDPAQLPGDPPAQAALEATVTIEPGLPVGAITQSLKMIARTDRSVDLEMPITGSVVSDISIAGRNFTQDRNVLNLGRVPRQEGKSETLRLVLKGPNRENAELRIASVDPESALRARIGEPRLVNNGLVHLYPLVIEVPPGVSPVNRLGSAQGKAGKIVLETNLSTAKQIVIYVRFAIE